MADIKVFDDRWYAGLAAFEVQAASVVYWPQPPDGMVIHFDGANFDSTIEQINQWHKDRGFIPRGSGPYPYTGYHEVVRRDGSRYVGRTLNVIGTHVLGHNYHLLGACLTGGLMNGYPTNEQYASIERICREWMGQFGFGLDRIFRHDMLNQTSCPGNFDLHRLITRLQGGASSVKVEVKQIEKRSKIEGAYEGLAIVDLDNVGNHASFHITFPAGKFATSPRLFLSQPNTNTHWGANLGSSDVTKDGANVYITDRGAALSGAHVGIAILALPDIG